MAVTDEAIDVIEAIQRNTALLNARSDAIQRETDERIAVLVKAREVASLNGGVVEDWVATAAIASRERPDGHSVDRPWEAEFLAAAGERAASREALNIRVDAFRATCGVADEQAVAWAKQQIRKAGGFDARHREEFGMHR